MNATPLRALEIEPLALSTLTVVPDARRPCHSSDEGPACPSQPQSPKQAILRWVADTMLLAGAGLGALYGGVWPDPSSFSEG